MESPPDLADRIRALPGMDRLLPALAGLPPAYLVGGTLRDLLRGEPGADLDVAMEGDAAAAARELGARLSGEVVEHGRFGTATVRAEGVSLDLARTRTERYPAPGALPEVEPAGLAEDLGRRDFSVNALAAPLADGLLGHLEDPHGGLDDVVTGTIRVLHPRSFIDDPTRLLRALRYEARLGYAMDAGTEQLAGQAAGGGAPTTLSGPRLRDALLALLAEREATAALERMHELGLDRSLHPELVADPDLAASAALAAGEVLANPALAMLAALVSRAPGELEAWVGWLDLPRGDRDAVLRAAHKGPQLAPALRPDLAPSAVHALLHCEPPEALAVALARGAPGEPVLRYMADLRGVRLEVTGDDLLAAGLEPSPAIGHALHETLKRKLDGEVSGREDELRLALELARESAG